MTELTFFNERIRELAGDNTLPLQKRFFRLPFNGTLSADELRMLNQGIGSRGSDYEELLRDLDIEDEPELEA